MEFANIPYQEEKNAGGIKELYLALTDDVAFPTRADDEYVADLTATFAQVNFLENTGSWQVDEQANDHGPVYTTTVQCTIAKDKLATLQQLNLYKYKRLTAVVKDQNDILRVVGPPGEGAYLTTSNAKAGRLAGGSNLTVVTISCVSTECPAHYSGVVTVIA